MSKLRQKQIQAVRLAVRLGDVTIASFDQVPLLNSSQYSGGQLVTMIVNFLRSGCPAVQVVCESYSDYEWEKTVTDINGMLMFLALDHEQFSLNPAAAKTFTTASKACYKKLGVIRTVI